MINTKALRLSLVLAAATCVASFSLPALAGARGDNAITVNAEHRSWSQKATVALNRSLERHDRSIARVERGTVGVSALISPDGRLSKVQKVWYSVSGAQARKAEAAVAALQLDALPGAQQSRPIVFLIRYATSPEDAKVRMPEQQHILKLAAQQFRDSNQMAGDVLILNSGGR